MGLAVPSIQNTSLFGETLKAIRIPMEKQLDHLLDVITNTQDRYHAVKIDGKELTEEEIKSFCAELRKRYGN